MKPKTAARKIRRGTARASLVQAIGGNVWRFQEASYAFDDVAASVLALHRSDLPVMTMLLFNGAASNEDMSAMLHVPRAAIAMTFERLQLAGYARPTGPGTRLELTEHARQWIRRIWEPLQREGEDLLDTYPTRDLARIRTFLRKACELQEARTHKLRTWLAVPGARARQTHLRGGLSPAALRRVQLFVEANLAHRIHLRDLAARAALSPYHFARAFRTSTGWTPYAFIEERRIERAKTLLAETTSSVADIAVQTGFATQSRLTTRFKHRTTFTPAVYRRNRRSSGTE
jgi:AraC family transcriptional regulator